jgi:arsenite/tail-anchored protein-transporting ATPase
VQALQPNDQEQPALAQRKDLVEHILSKRVLLISGKGGVGRTTLSAAIAVAGAAAGKRVLLTEIGIPGGDYSPLARLFGRDSFASVPESLRPSANGGFQKDKDNNKTRAQGLLRGSLLWSRSGHEQFLRTVIPVNALVRAAMGSKALSRLLDAAPSFNEMGVFYHLLSFLRDTRPDGTPEHDLIIIDMPATGHALALASLPEILLRLMPIGPIADALREGQSYLNDAKRAAAYVVTLPETLPVTESIELVEGLKNVRVPVGGVIVNKWVADEFSSEERAALAPLLASREFYGALRFGAVEKARGEIDRLARLTGVRILKVSELLAQGDALLDAVALSMQPRSAA